jgi:chemotaxis protein MotB
MSRNNTPHDLRPIVIKRRPVPRKVRHGGAWKLAYADFMTALMAFFLLMWLLGTVNTATLSGVAEYFQTPLAAVLNGDRAGDGILPGGGGIGPPSVVTDPGPGGSPPVAARPGVLKDGAVHEQAEDDADATRLRELKQHLEKIFDADAAMRAYRKQVLMDITPDGLRIQIVDTQNRPMFATAKADVEPYMQQILREIGSALNGVPNRIMLSGHTDAHPYAGGGSGYSNWELSSDRANASRRELVSGGMDPDKVLRVVGLASTQQLVAEQPLAPINRRISIYVLNHRAEASFSRENHKSGEVGSGANAAAVGELLKPAAHD